MENKIKEFLLRESLLRYTSVDRTQRSQAFISPLQGASDLLGAMNRGKLCPPPPDLDTTDPQTGEQGAGNTTDPKTGEQGAGRKELWHPQPPCGCLANPCCHVSFPVRPLQPVLPHRGCGACPNVYYGMAILLGSGGAAGPGSAASARYPEAQGGAAQHPQLVKEEEEAHNKEINSDQEPPRDPQPTKDQEPMRDWDKLKEQFHS